MTTVFDVPADALIGKAAAKLKERSELKPPEWAAFVKTGVHKEKPPEQADWWYTRSAAVLRKVYTRGPIGVERLRAEFGGKRDDGSSPYHAKRGSGSITRGVLQQLEDAKLVKRDEARKGRVVTPDGRRFLDGIAREVQNDLVATIPALAKY